MNRTSTSRGLGRPLSTLAWAAGWLATVDGAGASGARVAPPHAVSAVDSRTAATRAEDGCIRLVGEELAVIHEKLSRRGPPWNAA